MIRQFLGIDPGNSGGMAWLDAGGHVLEVVPMPKTLLDILEIMEHYSAWNSWAVIEDVHAMPKQGVTSMFTFAQNFGALLMALTAREIAFEKVTPQKWQREFGLIRPKQSKWTLAQKKNAHKARAQELLPGLKVTHATTDALLIAEYCRRLHLR